MGIIRMGPPAELVLRLANEFGITTFVETGTYYGQTATWASKYFAQVITIENSKEIYQVTSEKYNELANVNFLFGDSPDKLKGLVDHFFERVIFWLDAHWCGEISDVKERQCPILEELGIINKLNSDVFILIDDARLFTSPPQSPHNVDDWPDITSLIRKLNQTSQKRFIVIIEDVIIAVPIFAKDILVNYCQDVNLRNWELQNKLIKTPNYKRGFNLILQDLNMKIRGYIFNKIILKFKS